MKKILHLLLFLMLVFQPASAYRPLTQLVKRIMPGYEKQIDFRIEKSDRQEDYFELSQWKKGIRITANTPVSAAAGLNWYLKYYCHCSVSFCGDQLQLPKRLPEIPQPLRISTPLQQQFYMNYCTFSYTTAFWDWQRWEREIDLMALNGVTTPMAMVGVEVVWRNTLRKFGYTDEEIKQFLCGPAFFAWFLMDNLEGHGGPLPDEWFERQTQLQQKIVKRMREYGMTPVFQAFFGMVPSSLPQKMPGHQIAGQGLWSGFQRSPILLSTDSLFKSMAQIWYQEYEKLFGRTHCFAGDLFHEGGQTNGLNIANIARGVQAAMLDYNDKAQWYIQSWGANPRNELLAGLDKRHTVIIDLCAEYWKRWQERKGFGGFPWLWSHITNYGGNIGLHGRLDAIATGVTEAMADPNAAPSLLGTSTTPEGIELNPVTFDLGFEMRWHSQPVNVTQWLKQYSQRRYGIRLAELEKAWDLLHRTAYGTYPGHRRPSESVFCAVPSLKGDRITASAWSQCKIFYSPQEYAQGVALFLEPAEQLSSLPTYQYDAVDFVRQYLTNLGREAYYAWVKAYQEHNREVFRQKAALFLELLADQDRLLSTHPYFHVSRWLQQARTASKHPQIQDLYETNARRQIGTWSTSQTALRDYAHKEWGGMLKDYYAPRWKAYIDHLDRNWERRDLPAPNSYPAEQAWVESHQPYSCSNEDPVQTAVELFNKYYRK